MHTMKDLQIKLEQLTKRVSIIEQKNNKEENETNDENRSNNEILEEIKDGISSGNILTPYFVEHSSGQFLLECVHTINHGFIGKHQIYFNDDGTFTIRYSPIPNSCGD